MVDRIYTIVNKQAIQKTISSYTDLGGFASTTIPAGGVLVLQALSAGWQQIGGTTTSSGRVNATKTTSFSLASTDGITNIAPTATMTVTLPSSISDNVEYTFLGVIDTTKDVIFAAAAGTTIVSPYTYLTVSSFVIPGSTGQYYALKLIKNNNVWNIV